MYVLRKQNSASLVKFVGWPFVTLFTSCAKCFDTNVLVLELKPFRQLDWQACLKSNDVETDKDNLVNCFDWCQGRWKLIGWTIYIEEHQPNDIIAKAKEWSLQEKKMYNSSKSIL